MEPGVSSFLSLLNRHPDRISVAIPPPVPPLAVGRPIPNPVPADDADANGK